MRQYFKRVLGIDNLQERLVRLETALEMLPQASYYLRKADQECIKRESMRYDEIERTRKRRKKA